jgi:hypothetical protein
MTVIVAARVLVVIAAIRCVAQTDTQVPPPPPLLSTLSPPLPPPWLYVPVPDPLPSSADAPVPDLGKLTIPADPSSSRLKRAIDHITPRCLDAITHTCWSMPVGAAPPAPMSAEGRQFTQDMEVGDFNFKNRNYKGAVVRFRDALERKPGQPDALFKLAESLEKLGEKEEAFRTFMAYLEIQPAGLYSPQARNAIQRLAASLPQK